VCALVHLRRSQMAEGPCFTARGAETQGRGGVHHETQGRGGAHHHLVQWTPSTAAVCFFMDADGRPHTVVTYETHEHFAAADPLALRTSRPATIRLPRLRQTRYHGPRRSVPRFRCGPAAESRAGVNETVVMGGGLFACGAHGDRAGRKTDGRVFF